jgi:hypothetical protein
MKKATITSIALMTASIALSVWCIGPFPPKAPCMEGKGPLLKTILFQTEDLPTSCRRTEEDKFVCQAYWEGLGYYYRTENMPGYSCTGGDCY